MHIEGLISLAKYVLPLEIIENFDIVGVKEEESLLTIYLDETAKAEYSDSPDYESKGFTEAVTVRDFPIRDRGVDLVVRRRRWMDKRTGKSFSSTIDVTAKGTRYSKEFAAFLKEVYGDEPFELPFA